MTDLVVVLDLSLVVECPREDDDQDEGDDDDEDEDEDEKVRLRLKAVLGQVELSNPVSESPGHGETCGALHSPSRRP